MEKCLIEHIKEAVTDKPEGIIVSELSALLLEKNPGTDRKQIRKTLQHLLENEELMYVSRLGQTMICSNINRPVRISERIFISPPGKKIINAVDASPEIINVMIKQGIAFGSGIHPTTKMCLKAMDKVFLHNTGLKSVLDIGTGTGILAITSILFGAEKCIATDTDPCARAEAKENLEINDISKSSIIISDTDMTCFDQKFDLVTANLRYPTLVSLFPAVVSISDSGKFVILSGMRPDEKKNVAEVYSKKFTVVEEMTENEWSALILEKDSENKYRNPVQV